jgi:1-acyl-sn-glycerol-3-phosphate acyltransferase
MLPPRWVRRVVIAPAMFVLIGIVLLSAPLWLLGAAAISPLLPGRWRPLRFLWFVALYAILEFAVLLALFGLWVGSGPGLEIHSPRSQRAHYQVMGWFLRVLEWEAKRVLGVRFAVEGPPPSEYQGRPLVVMARHAGPGDSFLVVHALMNWYEREPRIVLKNTLQWDPAIDIILNRLPNRFIAPQPGAASAETERHIAELATGLDHDDSLVIFPEGGNFSTGRRQRAIARLHRSGHQRAAVRAERMVNVLPPRPGGVTAALRAATDADAVFVAHTGLEHLVTVGDLWRGLPMDTEIHMRWWRVPASEVPRDDDGIVEWLYGWWEIVDAWIGATRPVR